MEFVVALFFNADAIVNKISVAVGNWNGAERTALFQGFSYLNWSSVLYGTEFTWRIFLEI